MDVVTNYVHVFQYLNDIANNLNNFLNGVTALHAGLLTPALVSPSELNKSLRQLSHQLKSQFPEFSLLHKDAGFYYNHHLVGFTYSQTSIFIILEAQVVNHDVLYTLYTIKSFAVPIQTNTTLGYTEVRGLPQVLAITASGLTFIELSLLDLAACSTNQLIKCPQTFPFRHISEATCASAIFSDQADQITSECDIKIFNRKAPSSRVVQASPTTFLISSRSHHYQTLCKGQLYVEKKACVYCEIPKQCHCTMIVDGFEVPAQLCPQDIAPTGKRDTSLQSGYDLTLLPEIEPNSSSTDFS